MTKLSFWEADIKTVLGCSNVTARKVFLAICGSHFCFSNSTRAQLNRMYRITMESL